jgi:hypothetical protein
MDRHVPVNRLRGLESNVKLTKISGNCASDDCPAIYVTEAGTVIVQGTLMAGEYGVSLAAGEALVEVPRSIFMEAVNAAGW